VDAKECFEVAEHVGWHFLYKKKGFGLFQGIFLCMFRIGELFWCVCGFDSDIEYMSEVDVIDVEL
jgi:hypothetical protein